MLDPAHFQSLLLPDTVYWRRKSLVDRALARVRHFHVTMEKRKNMLSLKEYKEFRKACYHAIGALEELQGLLEEHNKQEFTDKVERLHIYCTVPILKSVAQKLIKP